MLSVERLSVTYGAIQAVRGINLSIEVGEIVTLLGANGAGKTTTLNAIMGLIPRSAGRVVFEERDLRGLSPEAIVRSGMTLTPEGRRIFPPLTVEENLILGGWTRRRDGGAALIQQEIYELFPILAERRAQTAGTLSGGEQQQLAIARSLMSQPKLLLLDEPSLGLAPQVVDVIFDLIVNLRDRHLTLLLVEQNVSRSLEIADRAYLLVNGEITFAGSASELHMTSNVERAYLGMDEE